MFRDLIRFRLLFCLNLIIIVAVAAACQAQAQPSDSNTTSSAKAEAPAAGKSDVPEVGKDKVVLKVGDLEITRAAFEQYVEDLESIQGPADMSRKKIGANYADMLMLSKIAEAEHLENDPQVRRLIAIDRMQVLSNAEFLKLKDGTKPSAEDIRAYYESHLEDYDVIHMRRMFIWPAVMNASSNDATGLTVEQATKLADSVRRVLKSGGDPNAIQKLINDTPHAKDSVSFDYEALYFQRGELPGRYNDTAFRMKDGEWEELHDSPGAYVFLQVVKHTRRSLEEVTPQIAAKLRGHNLKEQLESLKKKSGVWMDETYFVSKPEVPEMHERD